jgi:hypothetical protein
VNPITFAVQAGYFMPIDFRLWRALPIHHRSTYRRSVGDIHPIPQEIQSYSPRSIKVTALYSFSCHWGDAMSRVKLSVLRFLALFFLLPGLGGLVFSAMVSTDYLENLPRSPVPIEQRMTPRNVHGVVIFQTAEEDRRLSIMEYSSVSVFLIGLLLGIVYLEKWSSARQFDMEVDTDLLEEAEA